MSDVVKKFAPLFEPRSIAFVGASSNPLKWGFQIPFNLIEYGYKGKLYPVNPHLSELFNLRVYKTVSDIPEKPIDLAVTAVPAQLTLGVVDECARAGVRALIVITAGFSELGEEGVRAEAEMARIARESGMLVVGPNCMGVVSPYPRRLYCEMPAVKPEAGTIAMTSQSGNVGATIMRLAMDFRLGMSRCISTGNEASLHTEDYIEYFGDDSRTNVIAAYIEGVDDGKRFLTVARDVGKKKPVVVLKVGRTSAGKRAAKSHTGALGGEWEIFRGACRQAGVVEVTDAEELFDTVAAFAREPLPRGRRVAIVSEGGGWGVLAADACAEFGLDVIDLPEEVLKQLDEFLPSWWSRSNPVDLVGGLVEGGLVRSAEILLACDKVDGVIALGVGYLARRAAEYRRQAAARKNGGLIDKPVYEKFAEAAIARDVENAKRLAGLIDQYQKPLVIAAETISTVHVDENKALFALMDERVLVYPTPRRAARSFAHLANRQAYLTSIGSQP